MKYRNMIVGTQFRTCELVLRRFIGPYTRVGTLIAATIY